MTTETTEATAATAAPEFTATAVAAAVDAYLSAYGEPDRARRDALIRRAWAEDGRLIDPPLVGEGHRGISLMAEAVQAQFAGHGFRRVSGIDVHHGHLRFAWELVGPDGQVALAGMDAGELAGDGRLRRVTGFFGELPGRADA